MHLAAIFPVYRVIFLSYCETQCNHTHHSVIVRTERSRCGVVSRTMNFGVSFGVRIMSDPSDAEIRRDIDTLVERLQLKRWSEEERAEYVSKQDEHPLFMEDVPTVRPNSICVWCQHCQRCFRDVCAGW